MKEALMMAEESIGKNFIEQIIDKDIAEGKSQDFLRNRMDICI